MSVQSYVKYLNNVLQCIDGYPRRVSEKDDLASILGVALDISDLGYLDRIFSVAEGKSKFFRSYDFLKRPLYRSPLERVKYLIKDEGLRQRIFANLGDLANPDFNPDNFVLKGVDNLYSIIESEFISEMVNISSSSSDEYESWEPYDGVEEDDIEEGFVAEDIEEGFVDDMFEEDEEVVEEGVEEDIEEGFVDDMFDEEDEDEVIEEGFEDEESEDGLVDDMFEDDVEEDVEEGFVTEDDEEFLVDSMFVEEEDGGIEEGFVGEDSEDFVEDMFVEEDEDEIVEEGFSDEDIDDYTDDMFSEEDEEIIEEGFLDEDLFDEEEVVEDGYIEDMFDEEDEVAEEVSVDDIEEASVDDFDMLDFEEDDITPDNPNFVDDNLNNFGEVSGFGDSSLYSSRNSFGAIQNSKEAEANDKLATMIINLSDRILSTPSFLKAKGKRLFEAMKDVDEDPI